MSLPQAPNPSPPLVVIVGAGPAGCLAALLLARHGATVRLVDLRPDLRHPHPPPAHPAPAPPTETETETQPGSTHPQRQRSINLAVSARGIAALQRVGLQDALRRIAVPMYGRVVHLAPSPPAPASASARAPPTCSIAESIESKQEGEREGERERERPAPPLPTFQPYGQPHEHLLSVSRTDLTSLLLDACDAHRAITLSFRTKCVAIDLHAPSVTLHPLHRTTEETLAPTLIVGADGAFSKVRAAMAREPHFDFSQTYIPTLYKELTMQVRPTSRTASESKNSPADAASPPPPQQQQRFRPDGLHIWPRGEHMLIALPNDTAGHSFTTTLFLPRADFAALQTPQSVRAFFERSFPDAIAALPYLEREFFENPTPPLMTIRCAPYNFRGTAVLVGDAAHAIVPFYGQGANASLEDCALLADAVDRHGWVDLEAALAAYAQSRKPDADAIADLALEHYHDMSAKSASSVAVLRRRLEILANRLLPRRFLPLYSMISFSTIPYSRAVQRAKTQERAVVAAAALAFTAAVAATAFAVVRKVGVGRLDVRALLRTS